ncbi:MAG: glycerate kinase, partial [Muribaculaceae bacterium]
MKHIDNIVLAFDSFKGSASSAEIAEEARTAILGLLPHCRVSTFIVADGGEGTTEAI